MNRAGKIRKILVIDDDPEDLRLVKKMLEEDDKLQITLAQGGKNGWNAISQSKPDAIIMDLLMPDLDGFSLLGSLRVDPALRDIPVIILTGADLTPEQHQKLNEYGKQLLSKGYLREKELLITIEDALNRIRRPIPAD
jgi:threonine synthase